jgi:hypothetical protein
VSDADARGPEAESLEASVAVELSAVSSAADETESLVFLFVALVGVEESSLEAGDSSTALEASSATVGGVEVDS